MIFVQALYRSKTGLLIYVYTVCFTLELNYTFLQGDGTCKSPSRIITTKTRKTGKADMIRFISPINGGHAVGQPVNDTPCRHTDKTRGQLTAGSTTRHAHNVFYMLRPLPLARPSWWSMGQSVTLALADSPMIYVTGVVHTMITH